MPIPQQAPAAPAPRAVRRTAALAAPAVRFLCPEVQAALAATAATRAPSKKARPPLRRAFSVSSALKSVGRFLHSPKLLPHLCQQLHLLRRICSILPLLALSFGAQSEHRQATARQVARAWQAERFKPGWSALHTHCIAPIMRRRRWWARKKKARPMAATRANWGRTTRRSAPRNKMAWARLT